MAFEIEITGTALDELLAIKAFHRQRITDAMTSICRTNLRWRRGIAMLDGVQPPFEHRLPVWELRVAEYRVYYDVDGAASTVFGRSVRRKPPHIATEQVL